MQPSFTPQEQELIDKLRQKYAGAKIYDGEPAEQTDAGCLSCETGKTGAREGPRAQTRATSHVEASVCPQCHGTGTLVEIYNHRRLENYCKTCEGRGVRVFKDGVEVQSGASAPAAPLTSAIAQGAAGVTALHDRAVRRGADRAGGQQGQDGADSGSEAEQHRAAERVAALERDIERMAAKAAAYTKERLDASEFLKQPGAGGADASGRQAAARDLITQLDLQLDRLEVARRKKQAALEQLRKVAGGTLDDIIANEAPAS